jgi:hypothetical protein
MDKAIQNRVGAGVALGFVVSARLGMESAPMGRID